MSEKTETPANDSGEPDQESPDVAVNPKDATDGSGSQPEEAPDPEAEIASLQDKLLRSMAEFENFRRRSDREREDTAKYAIANFARDCLTTVDNLRRGLDSIDMDARKENAALETLAQGMELTERELLRFLSAMVLQRLKQWARCLITIYIRRCLKLMIPNARRVSWLR